MQSTNRIWRGLILVGALACLVPAVGGCEEQQLRERNAALSRQLEETLVQNAEMQGRVRRLENELATQPPAPEPEPTPIPPPPEPEPAQSPAPEFGEGVDVVVQGETMTVTLDNMILFAPGKADLRPSSEKVLSRIATELRNNYSDHLVRIEGHTDSTPIRKSKWEDNWELSCQRALSVLRHLVGQGIDRDRVYAAGYGAEQPVAPNSTAAGRAKNRRVEIVVRPR